MRLTSDAPGRDEFAQAYIGGEHYSVSLVISRVIGEACLYFSGNPPLVLAINRQFVSINNDGTFTYSGGETPVCPARGQEIIDTAVKAATVLGCQGYCGVDVVVADRVYVVDVNPRITTSLVGIAACMDEEIASLLVDASHGTAPGEVHLTGKVRFDTHGTVTPGMIGIDVGGANLKVVDENGVHIHYCPLWTGAPLTELLRQYATGRDDAAAVVMSGELADCFENKQQGIEFIVRRGPAGLPGCPVLRHRCSIPRWPGAGACCRKLAGIRGFPAGEIPGCGAARYREHDRRYHPALPVPCAYLAFRIWRGSGKGTLSIPGCCGHRWPPSFHP